MGRAGHEKALFIYIFPIIEGQEFYQIPLVALVVWDLFQHVLYPGSWWVTSAVLQVLMSEYTIIARYSLFSSCKALGAYERAWLEDVLVREKKGKDGKISNIPEELKALMPSNWQPLAVNSK